jgi:4-amino-4-deoxy-L-arabinose transferase-like glycosyltransferase
MGLASPTLTPVRRERETGVVTRIRSHLAGRADHWAGLALAVLFSALLAASWQRWTHPIVDHGREMNLPARLLAGEQLYADVQSFYGPFAPYFNAFLYRVFGVHLTVLHASGIACATLILFLIYMLARQLMTVWEGALTASLVLVMCAFKPSDSYVQPYAYAALYGLVFALGALVSAVRYAQGRGSWWLWGAGTGTGLALISKPEMAAAPLAASVVALLLGGLSMRRRRWREAAFFAVPVIAVGGSVYGFVLGRVPWHLLMKDLDILFTNVPPQLIYFNHNLNGLLEWPQSFWYALTGLGILGISAGAIALLGALLSRRDGRVSRNVAGRALGVAALGLVCWGGVILVFRVHATATPLTAASIVLVLVISALGWRGSRRRESLLLRQRLLLMTAVFSSLLIVRFFLNVIPNVPYAPFFLPPLLVVYCYLLFRVWPAYVAPPGVTRESVRHVAMSCVALLVLGIAITSGHSFRTRNTYRINTVRGSFLTDPRVGQPLAAAIRFVQQRTRPGDEVLTLPQGTSINFLADRRYPWREELVLPGVLAGATEAEVIRRLDAQRVPLILVVNLLTPEYRDRAFGEDYNRDLMRWIREHYQLAARFDSDDSHAARVGDKPFFILAFHREP